jgi:hypothetical protein
MNGALDIAEIVIEITPFSDVPVTRYSLLMYFPAKTDLVFSPVILCLIREIEEEDVKLGHHGHDFSYYNCLKIPDLCTLLAGLIINLQSLSRIHSEYYDLQDFAARLINCIVLFDEFFSLEQRLPFSQRRIRITTTLETILKDFKDLKILRKIRYFFDY